MRLFPWKGSRITLLTDKQRHALRRLPAVHRFMNHPDLLPLHQEIPSEYISQSIADVLTMRRREILEDPDPEEIDESGLVEKIIQAVRVLTNPHLKPVVNGTGIVLHTNLGRAVLSSSATKAISRIADSPSNLEYSLETGQRGSRHDHVEALLCRLTGAEDALVVNNNAAAVFLVLRTLANNREVIVSRGQLVEIGGSFRVSEIMRESGAHLVEVGTTNKTKIADYQKVIGEKTGLLMKVHRSNFKLVGFTEEVSREEMAKLAGEHKIPFYEDLGSGVLYDLKQHGIGKEPTVWECIKAGVDLVSFSGDKLLGGPQAGILVGHRKWIEELKRHQLARSLRVDKFTLAALEATLRHYLQPAEAIREIPTLRQILKQPKDLEHSAHVLKQQLEKTSKGQLHLEIHPSLSEVGGGSLPGVELPSICLVIRPQTLSVPLLERRLRKASIPIIGRVSRGCFHLDLRTVEEKQFPDIINSFQEVLTDLPGV